MASSSRSCDYDVFLSFRGKDTRKIFVDCLYYTLNNRGIFTYKDDETLPRGESINPALLKAIEGSQIAVIVFSENYADSSWCLDELEHIMKCRDEGKVTVIPIFYGVVPSDVRKQEGHFGKGFAIQVARNNSKVELWRKALVDATNISGWEPKNMANGFRGKDTRNIFVDCLYYTLNNRGISTYKDDETLPRGESIHPALLKAIEGSQIAVIVFSENYADSSWCLDELEHIMKCRDEGKVTVIPIFYGVVPSDVRKQEGHFGKGFAIQVARNNSKVELWRKALVDASNISGWEPKNMANG